MWMTPRTIAGPVLTFVLMSGCVAMMMFYFLAPYLGTFLTAMLSCLGGVWAGRLAVRAMYGIGKGVL